MVTITRFDKTNTIISESPLNLGLNPIIQLGYGDGVSRGLAHFPVDRLRCLVEDKTYADMSKLRHVLKMTNCGSVDVVNFKKPLFKGDASGWKERASSFDILFFLAPMEWDSGRGFDYGPILWNNGNSSLDTNGSNWYQARNGYPWPAPGVYDTDFLSLEYDKFSSSGGSDIIIGRQHFDYGNESVELDITETVNKYISGELANHGICIAFSPDLEHSSTQKQQYTGFFGTHTHTFFEPMVLTTYGDHIEDDRNKFHLDKPNKLYFYFTVNGFPANLDNVPSCSINGAAMPVGQTTKGAYYAEVGTDVSSAWTEDTMMRDEWSGAVYKGREMKPVELDFVVRPSSEYFGLGTRIEEYPRQYVPSVTGINDGEQMLPGEVRRVTLTARIPYTTNQYQLIDGMEYRLYVRNGDKGEIDVIPYQPLERDVNANYFVMDTSGLLPGTYFVDVRVRSGMDLRYHRGLVKFHIVNDETDARV